jgi:hypothetical protein
MGLDHEANRRTTRKNRKVAQRRRWNKWRRLIERRQMLAHRLKQVDAVLRNLDNSEGSRGEAC